MSVPFGHLKRDVMTSVSASRSRSFLMCGQGVANFFPQRLPRGCAAAQGIEANPVHVKVDFAADQSVGPQAGDLERVAEQADRAPRVGPPQEHQAPTQWSMGVEAPVPGERPACGGPFPPRGGSGTSRGPIGRRSVLQGGQRLMVEAGPDFSLPAPVKAFNGRLKAHLLWRHKDRRDPKTQANPHHPADHVGIVMGAMEPRLVVELGIGRQANHAPVGDQQIRNEASREPLRGPRIRFSAVQRDAGQDVHLRSMQDDQPFDDVEALEFRVALRDLGQIPAWRGSGATDEGTVAIPRRCSSSRMAGAPYSPSTLASLSSRRTVTTVSSMARTVRRVRRGIDGRSVQSTRSSRLPAARWTQYCTVERLTRNCRATARWEIPHRTALTMARRWSATRLSCPFAPPVFCVQGQILLTLMTGRY